MTSGQRIDSVCLFGSEKRPSSASVRARECVRAPVSHQPPQSTAHLGRATVPFAGWKPLEIDEYVEHLKQVCVRV